MTATSVQHINVGLDFGSGTVPVGRLARRDRQIYFEYDTDFIKRALPLSPFRLPLVPGIQTFDNNLFEGLPGVFNDSLPDGWGRLLFDRAMRAKDLLPESLGPLDRLAAVGLSGMGALVYEPDRSDGHPESEIDLDWLAERSREVLEGEADDVLGELLALNGSSAGARPKALIGYHRETGHIMHGGRELPQGYEPWLVKFANTQDARDAGAVEFVYASMARQAGLDIPDMHLFPSKRGAGYFSVKRFDRNDGRRIHMHTACGMLHSDFRTPSLDYRDLLDLTTLLTRDVRETEKMFRLAVFNVLAHNRDDHSKNFTFLMDETGEWRLSPAYDLTFSSGPGGEQSTMVMGNGKAPGVEQLRALGGHAQIAAPTIDDIILQTSEALNSWVKLAKNSGVGAATTKRVARLIC